MIYVTSNTNSPTGYFRTADARQAVRVARCWQRLGRLNAIDVMIGGGDRPLRTVRVPCGKTRDTIAAIRAAMA
jgi:hypothetical protein